MTDISRQAITVLTMLTRKKLQELRRAKNDGPNKLKLAAELAGLTQTEIAERIELAQSQVSEDMNGKALEVSLAKARTYADLFGCTVDDIFPSREQVSA